MAWNIRNLFVKELLQSTCNVELFTFLSAQSFPQEDKVATSE